MHSAIKMRYFYAVLCCKLHSDISSLRILVIICSMQGIKGGKSSAVSAVCKLVILLDFVRSLWSV